MSLFIFTSLMVASATIDMLVTKWTIYVQKRQIWHGASASALWHVVNGFCVVEYTHNPRYVIAMAVGGFVGTAIGIWLSRRAQT